LLIDAAPLGPEFPETMSEGLIVLEKMITAEAANVPYERVAGLAERPGAYPAATFYCSAIEGVARGLS
jgi:hypothetical protein